MVGSGLLVSGLPQRFVPRSDGSDGGAGVIAIVNAVKQSRMFRAKKCRKPYEIPVT